MKGDRATRTAVVVGTVTNDLRLFEVPKLTVCIQFFLLNRLSKKN